MCIAIAKYVYNNYVNSYLLLKFIDIVSYRHVIITIVSISYRYENCNIAHHYLEGIEASLFLRPFNVLLVALW